MRCLCLCQGYATLDLLRSTPDESARQRIASEAAGPLFCAAAGLGGDTSLEKADAPAAGGAAAAPNGVLIGDLLRVLCTEMTGAFEAEGPQARLFPCGPLCLPALYPWLHKLMEVLLQLSATCRPSRMLLLAQPVFCGACCMLYGCASLLNHV